MPNPRQESIPSWKTWGLLHIFNQLVSWSPGFLEWSPSVVYAVAWFRIEDRCAGMSATEWAFWPTLFKLEGGSNALDLSGCIWHVHQLFERCKSATVRVNMGECQNWKETMRYYGLLFMILFTDAFCGFVVSCIVESMPNQFWNCLNLDPTLFGESWFV